MKSDLSVNPTALRKAFLSAMGYYHNSYKTFQNYFLECSVGMMHLLYSRPVFQALLAS